MIKVAVFEKDARVRSLLSESLAAAPPIEASQASSWSELIELIARDPGTVVILGPSSEVSDMSQVAGTAREFPGTGFILVVEQLDARVLKNAMRSGINDVIAAEDMEEELLPAIERTFEAESDELTRSGLGGPVRNGKVIAVFGPKGGTGKTVVATNMAVLMAEAGIHTCLLDASVRF